MDGGLLSLKWNNHRSTFFYVLSNVRKKECYTDVTLACEGKFYPVHKLVLSTCSEYFEQMFEQTQCKHPVIVLKDIRSEELESLLSYMYVGEVNVVQEKLSGLIKAAECLRIKGLAVPDEEPCSKPSTSREKRSSDNSLNSEPKRRRQDDSGNTSSFRQGHSNNRNDDRRKSLDHPSSSNSNKFRNTNSSNSNVNSNRASSGDRESGDRGSISNRVERLSSPASNNQHAATEVKTEDQVEASEAEAPPDEVTIDEPNEPVKQEPVDLDAVYLSDSNSATEAKDILMENFGDSDGQQHFMDELLGQNSGSDQGNMGVGDYGEGGEGSSSAPSGAGGQQQQQHMSPPACSYSGALPPGPVEPVPAPSTRSIIYPPATALTDAYQRVLASTIASPSFTAHHLTRPIPTDLTTAAATVLPSSIQPPSEGRHPTRSNDRTPRLLSSVQPQPPPSEARHITRTIPDRTAALPSSVQPLPHSEGRHIARPDDRASRVPSTTAAAPSEPLPAQSIIDAASGTLIPFEDLPMSLIKTAKSPTMLYSCPLCQKEFYNKGAFRSHYFMHSRRIERVLSRARPT